MINRPGQAELGLIGGKGRQAVAAGIGVGMQDTRRAPVGSADQAGAAILDQALQRFHDFLYRPFFVIPMQPINIHMIRLQIVQAFRHIRSDLRPAQAALLHLTQGRMCPLGGKKNPVPIVPVRHPAADHLFAFPVFGRSKISVHPGGIDQIAVHIRISVHKFPGARFRTGSAKFNRSQSDHRYVFSPKAMDSHSCIPPFCHCK